MNHVPTRCPLDWPFGNSTYVVFRPIDHPAKLVARGGGRFLGKLYGCGSAADILPSHLKGEALYAATTTRYFAAPAQLMPTSAIKEFQPRFRNRKLELDFVGMRIGPP